MSVARYLELALLLLHAAAQVSSSAGSCYEGSYASQIGPFGPCAGFKTCEPGSYCLSGVKQPCPAGTYGNASGLTSADCSGPCPAGYYCALGSAFPLACLGHSVYCPIKSISPIPVSIGHYTGGGDAATGNFMKMQVICPLGSYCVGGMRHACPAGTFGDISGLFTQNCSGICPEGSYCPTGTDYPWRYPCGSRSTQYCPVGSARPLVTAVGYYAIPRTPSTSYTITLDPIDSHAHITYIAQEVCPIGSYCIDGVRQLCPAGRYGNARQLSSMSCSGPCFAGWYCPEGSIKETMFPCGGADYYCPSESATPLLVSQGYYTSEADSTVIVVSNHSDSKDIHPRDLTELTADDMGLYRSTKARQQICTAGYYCQRGIRWSCPAGRYGASSGLYSSACSGACSKGYYCPENSTSSMQFPCGAPWLYCPSASAKPLEVQVGYYSVNGDGSDGVGESFLDMGDVLIPNNSTRAAQSFARSTRVDQRLCESGYYCINGTRKMCSAGRYGMTYGLSTSNCSGICKEGYYCPLGSSLATQLPCGDPAVYCPIGVGRPVKVSLGYYTIGDGSDSDTVATRVSQVIAPKGHYAINGILLPCPAGYYGSTEGLRSSTCSGPCTVKGFFCPVASTSPMQRVCGGDNLYCDGDRTVAPVHVLPGFYTTDYSSLYPNTQREVLLTSEGDVARLGYNVYINNKKVAMQEYQQFFSTNGFPRSPCPPGQFRNWTGLSFDPTLSKPSAIVTSNIVPNCELCPIGTYKATNGDDISLCLPCNVRNSQSSANRILCECTTVVTGLLESSREGIYYFDITSGECKFIRTGQIPYINDATWAANISVTRYKQHECEAGYFCIAGVRYPCPAGRYGLSPREQNPQCTGPCHVGHYCLQTSASPVANLCGGANYYCPEGSSEPQFVSDGFYTNESEPLAVRSSQTACPPGYYCVGGLRHPCARGTYASKYGTSNPSCEGKCSSGHYCLEASPSSTQFVCGSSRVFCPEGSWMPTPTTNGFYCIHTGPKAGALDLLDPDGTKCSAEIPCPPGYYCVDGIKSPCPPGTFGWRYGLNSSECSGQCAAGYYCPSILNPAKFPDAPAYTVWSQAPHISAVDFECGNVAYFCPKGSWYPKHVSGGYFTIGGDIDNATRTDQVICPPGRFCQDGVAYDCPKGRYGATEGLISSLCTDWCPAGAYCTQGTAQPVPCPPGYFSNNAAWACSLCPGMVAGNESASIKMPCQNDRSCCYEAQF